MSESLAHFLEQYRESWNALDAARISDHYLVPAAINDRDGARVYDSYGALFTKFQRGVEALRGVGFAGCSYVVGLNYSLGSDAAAVDLDWQLQATAAPLMFRTLYVCHNTDKGWRIYAAHAYRGSGGT
jgi:hypothetical protein